jgi:hypothetical protein
MAFSVIPLIPEFQQKAQDADVCRKVCPNFLWTDYKFLSTYATVDER